MSHNRSPVDGSTPARCCWVALNDEVRTRLTGPRVGVAVEHSERADHPFAMSMATLSWVERLSSCTDASGSASTP